jgi:hypothetical protein
MSDKNLLKPGFYLLCQFDEEGNFDSEFFSFYGPYSTLEKAESEKIKKKYNNIKICNREEIIKIWQFIEVN